MHPRGRTVQGPLNSPCLKILGTGSFCNTYTDCCEQKQLHVSEKLPSSIRTPFKLLRYLWIFPVNISSLATSLQVSYCSFVFFFICFHDLFDSFSESEKKIHHTFNFFGRLNFMNAPLAWFQGSNWTLLLCIQISETKTKYWNQSQYWNKQLN